MFGKYIYPIQKNKETTNINTALLFGRLKSPLRVRGRRRERQGGTTRAADPPPIQDIKYSSAAQPSAHSVIAVHDVGRKHPLLG
ncbi:hypothetical protein J6590_019195 [Homalodisca vitripennis]|nr:hypothetical protein J6590_019195 [Homalodisca vitripennis]